MEEVKCPRCASMNTEEIHDEVNVEEETPDYSLASGRIERDEVSEEGRGPRYHCHDCKTDFGSASLRKGILSDAERRREATRNILFEAGGLMQGFFTLRLERTEDGHFMQVSPGFIPDRESGRVEAGKVSITSEQWDAVMSGLYEDLFVLDWKQSYENPYVMDGQQWRLTLTMENGEELRYHGMNSYPVYWDKALQLLDPLSIIGVKEGAWKVGMHDHAMTNPDHIGRATLARSKHRFDMPERIAELDPEGTLKRFGLRDGQVVCDIGAGTGAFAFPAATLTRNKVYALDVDDEMLDIIKGKIKKTGTLNVIPMKGDGETLDFEDGSVDLVLMVTVFHHIADKPGLLREIRRVLKNDGRFGMVEFHNRVTPSGPPVENRIGEEEVTGFLEAAGFEEVEGFDIGENFYAKVFRTGKSASSLDKGKKDMQPKPKVAFVCVHNSCRSQIAEALGKHLAGDVFESYSAGTETKPRINQDAVRIMKEDYGIDMEAQQHSKLLSEIPEVDVVITMGCNVECPYLPSQHREDWGLDDPSGESDEVFRETISRIESNIRDLAERIMTQSIRLR